jgi:hypothetical protein
MAGIRNPAQQQTLDDLGVQSTMRVERPIPLTVYGHLLSPEDRATDIMEVMLRETKL